MRHRSARRMWEVSVMCAATTLFGAIAQAAPHIRLKGRAQIDVRLSRESGALVLIGAVADDLARPLPEAVVAIGIDPASEQKPTPLPLRLAAIDACRGVGSVPEFHGPSTLVLHADREGRFCTGLTLEPGQFIARIATQASTLVDSGKIELAVDLRLPPVTLRFDPETPAPRRLSLDDETITFETVASIEDEETTSPATGIALSLSNERGESLGTARTDSSGRARFTMDSVRLGDPGTGELLIHFAGDETAGASTHAMRIERRTLVDLSAVDGEERRPPIHWLDDDIAVRVIATPRCARRGCKTAATGTIEARRSGDSVMAAAPLNEGVARLVIASSSTSPQALPSARDGDSPAIARYVPDVPWFQPAGEVVLPQTLRGASPWRKVPLALAAIAVIAWLAFARLPIGFAERVKTHAQAPVRLVRSAPPSHGWAGFITDAHDGVAIPGVRIAVERRGFEGIETLAEASTDDSGAFALPPIASQARDELVAEGRLYAKLRRPLPPSGELAVALVLRKRALLDRFVAWARRQGTFSDTLADPTPRQVQQMAGVEPSVVRWASALEWTVYGGGVVDERGQAQVDSLAPPSLLDDVDGTRPRSL